MIEPEQSPEIRVAGQFGRDVDLLHLEAAKTIGAVVSYIGRGYSGFAYQVGHRTVAGELLGAMEICIGFRPKLTVAGRTDSGVNARAQVISFQIPADAHFDWRRFVKSMNSLMDDRVSVRRAWLAKDDFNARFSARYRKYRYRFTYCATRDPFESFTSWMIPKRLDVAKMREAAEAIRGEHDFSSFCRKDPNGASLVRRVDDILLEEDPDGLDVWITANSFCHQMVRSITGLLYQVGMKNKSPECVLDALCARDRARVTLLAPASGLTLWEVGYDEGVIPEWR